MDLNLPLPIRKKDSHKGQQGRVMVIGGSKKYYGAPILTALGAEHSGADLITLILPKAHQETAKHYSLNFFIHGFCDGDDLSISDLSMISKLATDCDALVIGNGLAVTPSSVTAINAILEEVQIPTIIDAGALQPETLPTLRSREAPSILTPHSREFQRMFGMVFSQKNLQTIAQNEGPTICVKGMVDYIAKGTKLYENKTGSPEMRVGGTGDVLAGIITSYVAQGVKPFKASCLATHYYGKCGEKLSQIQKTFTAYELIQNYPKLIFQN